MSISILKTTGVVGAVAAATLLVLAKPSNLPPAPQPAPQPELAEDIVVPSTVQGRVNSYIQVLAKTQGQIVLWETFDDKLSLVPAEMVNDPKKAIVHSNYVGKYTIYCWTAINNRPTKRYPVAILVNDPLPVPPPTPPAPTPPAPPSPTPPAPTPPAPTPPAPTPPNPAPPTPTPPSPAPSDLAKRLQAAFENDKPVNRQSRLRKRDKLASIFEVLSSKIENINTSTPSDQRTVGWIKSVKDASQAGVLASDDLLGVRQILAKEFAAVVGDDFSADILPIQAKIVTWYESAIQAIDSIK